MSIAEVAEVVKTRVHEISLVLGDLGGCWFFEGCLVAVFDERPEVTAFDWLGLLQEVINDLGE